MSWDPAAHIFSNIVTFVGPAGCATLWLFRTIISDTFWVNCNNLFSFLDLSIKQYGMSTRGYFGIHKK